MSANVPTDFTSKPVAVIGAGTLGRRMALIFTAHGADVRIYDLVEPQLRAAVDFVSHNVPSADRNGIVPGRVSPDADLADAVREAWLVIEAIPERLSGGEPMPGSHDVLMKRVSTPPRRRSRRDSGPPISEQRPGARSPLTP